MTILTTCLDPHCDAPASVAETWTEASTAGPVQVARVVCAGEQRHHVTTHDGRPDCPPPLARQPACAACGHEQHSPTRCEHGACECTVVPVPGINP